MKSRIREDVELTKQLLEGTGYAVVRMREGGLESQLLSGKISLISYVKKCIANKDDPDEIRQFLSEKIEPKAKSLGISSADFSKAGEMIEDYEFED